MIEVITNISPRATGDSFSASNADASQTGHYGQIDPAQADFQAMVDGDESGESWDSTKTTAAGNGIMQMVRNVEAGKAGMQSALLNASITPTPQATFAASEALSRYDLQTLFLSKVANKAFQAVDRLTNLQ